jgi:hypothetical protein
MLSYGIFKKYEINQIYYQKFYLNHFFLRFFIYTHEQIILCQMAMFMIFETFKIKKGG